MGQKCGKWIEDGETVTYDPCPPDVSPPAVPLAMLDLQPFVVPGAESS